MTLILYVVEQGHPHYKTFPVNFLRNTAIRACKTTHFQILDMDLRMTSTRVGGKSAVANTYAELKALPSLITASNTSAVILPIFFFNHTTVLEHCNSVENCAFLYRLRRPVTNSTNYYQPENKLDLVACVATGNCVSNKRLVRTHVAPQIRVDV